MSPTQCPQIPSIFKIENKAVTMFSINEFTYLNKFIYIADLDF